MIFVKTIKNFISNDECKIIIEKFDVEKELYDSLLYNPKEGINLNKKYRDSRQNFVDIPELKYKINELIKTEIKVKGFEIEQVEENFQFTKYNINSHFDWHNDSSGYEYRFCTIVIQLNDDYEGGELLYKKNNDNFKYEHENIVEFERGLGNLYIFNSSLEHKVNLVTKGVRYSLVNWLNLKPKNDNKTLL